MGDARLAGATDADRKLYKATAGSVNSHDVWGVTRKDLRYDLGGYGSPRDVRGMGQQDAIVNIEHGGDACTTNLMSRQFVASVTVSYFPPPMRMMLTPNRLAGVS